MLKFWRGKTEDDESLVTREPVVGWRITDRNALPVTPDDDDLDNGYSILCPDGSVITPYSQRHESEAA